MNEDDHAAKAVQNIRKIFIAGIKKSVADAGMSDEYFKWIINDEIFDNVISVCAFYAHTLIEKAVIAAKQGEFD